MDTLFLEKFGKLKFVNGNGSDILSVLKSSKAHDNNPYHEESLYQHLLLTARSTQDYAESKGWTDSSNWLYFIGGFFHDIGKHGAYRPRYKKSRTRYTTKGHALLGAAMLESWIMTPEFMEVFNLDESDAESIVLATNYHMCIKEPLDEDRLRCLRMCLSEKAKHVIVALRYGDYQGRETDNSVPLALQEDFEKVLLERKDEEEEEELGDGGILINITGYSGSGKTHMARSLIEYLTTEHKLVEGVDVVHINRDNIISEVVVSNGFAPEGSNTYAVYKKNKAALANKVNRAMQDKIANFMTAKRICIVDTMACMNPLVKKTLLERVSPSSVRIDLWAHRYPETFTEEETRRKGLTLEEQRAINSTGAVSFFDVFGSNIPWFELVSVLESRICVRNNNDKHRSHFCIPIAHKKNMMFDYFRNTLLKKLIRTRQNFPPTLEESENLSLQELIQLLLKTGVCVEKFFKAHQYLVTSHEITAGVTKLCIKYIDTCNRLWIPKWAREARGVGFIVDKREREAKVIKIKTSFSRSVELLTRLHRDEKIETSQDISSKDRDLSFLDKDSRDMIQFFNNEDKIMEPFPRNEEWYLDDKVDGSLLVVSIYPKKSEIFKYFENIEKRVWYILTDEFLIVPSTSGSLHIGDKMKSTFVTAVGEGCFNMKFQPSENVEDIWRNKLRARFAHLMLDLVIGNNSKTTTVVAEMVCKNRQTYDGYVHRELAVKYPQSATFLLAMFVGEDPVHNIPHSVLNNVRDRLSIPRSRRIDTPYEALRYMENLSDTLTTADSSAKQMWLDNALHAEGFVVKRQQKEKTTLCKMKMPLYYRAHALDTTVDDVTRTSELVFPEVARRAYIKNVLPVNVKEFCNMALEQVIIPTMDSDKDTFPEAITRRVEEEDELDEVYRYITATTNTHNFTDGLVAVCHKSFGGHVRLDDQSGLVKELRNVLLDNKPWMRTQNATTVRKNFLRFF